MSPMESLESRQLMSVSLTNGVLTVIGTAGNDKIQMDRHPYTGNLLLSVNGVSTQYASAAVSKVVVNGLAGNDLITCGSANTKPTTIYGGGGNDTITGSGGNDYIDAGLGNDSIHGAAGNDTVIGGWGNDAIFGDAGSDYLRGYGDSVMGSQSDNDVIVSIGGGSDTVEDYEGLGTNNLWTDQTGVDTVITNSQASVHRVTSFANTALKELNGPNLTDPASTFARKNNFKTSPLFADQGPGADDVFQGSLGDCYFLAGLSSIAKVNPNLIRHSVVALGDGTFAVEFHSGATTSFIRVDADLATFDSGGLAYAKLGRGGSLWVAVMEKAFAFFRNSANSYAGISGGWLHEPFTALGAPNSDMARGLNGTQLLQAIQRELRAGRAVTFGVRTGFNYIIGGHAYMVDSVLTDASGNVTSLRLRNPWGTDGVQRDTANDGYITLSATEAFNCMMGWLSATV